MGEATLEPVNAFRAAHPFFLLEDELFLKGEEMLYGRKRLPEEEEKSWLGLRGDRQRCTTHDAWVTARCAITMELQRL